MSISLLDEFAINDTILKFHRAIQKQNNIIFLVFPGTVQWVFLDTQSKTYKVLLYPRRAAMGRLLDPAALRYGARPARSGR